MRETALLETLFRLTPPQKAGLKKLKIETALDLLYHFPSRYVSSAQVLEAELTPGEKVTVLCQVISQKDKKHSFFERYFGAKFRYHSILGSFVAWRENARL